MFNFHKPRTYRSAEGCCICRAKSSSSRFTDSRKYERDTMQCFDLKYPRQGEICNACVLLVKRFKRLPVGSKRNWSHVVDARAGPGGSKIQTKYKSERIGSRTHQSSTNSNSSLASPPSSSSCISNSSTGGSPNSTANGQPMSFIPEKFSKIFKKTKKIKESLSSSSLSSSHSSLAKRKSSSNGWSHNGLHSLPTTPDSLDSDYEDSRMHSSLTSCGTGSAAVVQFQTQTRASAFRAQAAAEARRRTLKLGSKRRKCLVPRKNRRTATNEETLHFFDEEEWREKKSCCGMLYECSALGGALIVDVANYKPCEKHQQKSTTTAATTIDHQSQSMPLVMPPQKPIIHHSIPAVVQLQPPAPPTAALAMMSSCASSSNASSSTSSILLGATERPSALTITKSTPVLKKHHLFFKRQSECFPQGDMVTQSETTAANYSSSSNPVNITKTESDYNNRIQHHLQQTQHQQHHQMPHPHHQSTTIFQRHSEHAIHSSAAPHTNYATVSSSGALSISVTSVAAPSSSSLMPMSIPSSSSSSSSSLFTSNMPQMPKHSLAKVTTISPPLTASHSTINTSMPLSKPNSFLHKIKADSGKIVKHSLEKFNTAVRLKTSDLHDMKPIIKTVDKSYILAKPPTMANINTLNAATGATTAYQTLSTYNSSAQPPLTTASLSAASPTSSTSSTSSTKFSDNSSDSGFDENMLDRKSASPLQEDCEKKLLSRPGVQTMFLASGVQIQGQPQNLVLTGNEVAAKILQSRKYSSITTTPVTSNTRALSTNLPTTTAVKIAQISTGNGHVGGHHSASSSVMSSAAQAKMRAIYNNSNTIQHENGITTIVPASSLAATTQTAAMQNIAPSTVTITPAPPVSATQYNNVQNIISRKLTAANIINLQSNNLSNTTTATNLNGSNSCSGGNNNHLNSAAAVNQKIILLKTSSSNNNNSMAATMPSSALSMSTSSAAAASLSSAATMTKYSGR